MSRGPWTAGRERGVGSGQDIRAVWDVVEGSARDRPALLPRAGWTEAVAYAVLHGVIPTGARSPPSPCDRRGAASPARAF
jgi:hypothetical protein